MEHSIDSTFIFNNVRLKVQESKKCNKCYFNSNGGCNRNAMGLHEFCSTSRKDNKCVIFVQVPNLKSTSKQIQARRRAFMIMQLSGMITNLKRMRDIDVRAWYLKGMINVCINAIFLLLERLQSFTFNNLEPSTKKANREILKMEKCETWHQLFNPN